MGMYVEYTIKAVFENDSNHDENVRLLKEKMNKSTRKLGNNEAINLVIHDNWMQHTITITADHRIDGSYDELVEILKEIGAIKMYSIYRNDYMSDGRDWREHDWNGFRTKRWIGGEE